MLGERVLGEIALVAGKDLRVEARSRVAVNQIAPFALLVLVLFGIALDADRPSLEAFTPGLYWVAVLLAAVLAVHRAVAIDSGDGVDDAVLLSGLEPASVFLGKALALVVQLLVLAALLVGGVIVLYGATVDDPVLLIVALVSAVVGIASAGTLYGALIAGQRARETVLPIVLLPVLAPVLIAATRAFGDALGTVAADGWSWLLLLVGFASLYTAIGAISYRYLTEGRA